MGIPWPGQARQGLCQHQKPENEWITESVSDSWPISYQV